ncbi:Co2+/Mg2+ efflux protein ApaG [Vibrio sp. UCD-FRSSP16_10]|uniref:Co2+/Mg2+ efflux protein ApaG n=1 Tax=unclassified Vibrio TaxID=2614977 RepID=UPI0007FD49FF|nr:MULTISPECIES: Co2+/Mg2+ efflux protein ApaG [unclassified Vibrio]OBT16769.1 Co2+/Mg2+ efflux protein ApaG [Vibrio sp. UCD-FRSSP16_30]OBT21396.1 Co2+/Mg2+ efflux protein ApaG [Vibrio sp. UCD-FRSSP16_10]
MDVSQPCIKCHVQTKYIEAQSEPDNGHYVFAYMITIRNLSQHPVQLLSRYWLITDGNGKQITVEGDGVVGEKPTIAANDDYTYTSGSALETPVGVMQGHYVMQTKDGALFNAQVAPFNLSIPNIIN